MADETFLVRISGPDGPGLLAGVLESAGRAGSTVDDIEQITIHGHLDLSLVLTAGADRDLLKELLLFGWERGVHVDFEVVDSAVRAPRTMAVVTLLARDPATTGLAAIAAAVAGIGGNIERIVRLARYPVTSYELLVADAEVADLRPAVMAAGRANGIDVAVQRDGLHRRATRLVVMDVDSTLIQDEVIDLLAAEAGCEAEVSAITAAAMRGELDFEESLRARVMLLRGLPTDAVERVRSRVRLTPGARTFVRTLHRLGYRTAIVSGGFTGVTDHLRAELGIDHAHANVLGIAGGVLTGEVVGPIVDRAGKARILREVAAAEQIPLDQVVAVGDGANDLDMLDAAGLGIAFNAKPAVRDAAPTAVNVPYLDAILFLLGVRRDDVEAADGA